MANQLVTTRTDLPPAYAPAAQDLFGSLLQMLFPDTSYNSKGEIQGVGAPSTYAQLGGVYAPTPTNFSPLEQYGQNYAEKTVAANAPLQNASRDWFQSILGTGDSNAVDTPTDIANMTQQFTMGGKNAGAARESLLTDLTGNTAKAAQQRMVDAIYGNTPKAAEDAIYGMLNPQNKISTQAAFDTIGGDLAGAARGQDAKTINGDYLSPDSNPWLRSTIDEGTKAISDAYKYGTAPSTAGQFARSGSYGGSAHQQTMGMQQFDLGRNLSDYVNKALSSNYQNERQNQLGVTGQERGYTQSQLAAERASEAAAAENSLQNAQGAAQNVWTTNAGLTQSQLALMEQAAQNQLGLGAQAQSLLPASQAASYYGSDVLSQIGAQQRQLQDSQNQVGYQNALTNFQWPFNIYNILGSALGSFTGGQGVTTQTSPNPNAISPVAQGLGGAALGATALSAIGSLGNKAGWWGPDAGGGAGAGAGN